MSLERLKKELEKSKPIFGFKRTIKNIKLGKTKLVFLAGNCPKKFMDKITPYNIGVIQLKEHNAELALICKRPHSISIISF